MADHEGEDDLDFEGEVTLPLDDGAEQCFIDGWLQHRALLQCDPEAVQNRVDAAIAVAKLGRDGRQGDRRRWGSVLLCSAAAAVLAVMLLIASAKTSPRLSASVRRVVEAAHAEVDRSYAVVLTGGAGRRDVDLTLHVRGGLCFVVERTAVRGTVRCGFDGEQAWLVPARSALPVVLFDDGSPGFRGAGGVGMPFYRMTRLLDRLEEDFTLRADPDSDTLRIVARARRDDRESWLPRSLQIVADPASGVVRSLELRWDPRPGLPSGRRMSATLIGETSRDANFYRHTTHHETGRPVRRR